MFVDVDGIRSQGRWVLENFKSWGFRLFAWKLSANTLAIGNNLTDGVFYNYSTPTFRFFAYSAFYDDRPSLLSSPTLRIIAISDPIGDYLKSNKSLFCVLHHTGGVVRVQVEASPKTCGPGYLLNGKYAEPYVYTCPDSAVIPYCVSIEGTDGEATNSCLPIQFPFKPREQKEFAVCVPVSYGNLNPYHLIEWLEVQRILGISLIYVYDLYLSDEASRVLKYYAQNEEFVEFRKIERIYSFEFNAHILEIAISLNDCLYRHMYEARRIIVSDFDEFIKPHMDESIHEMVGDLERTLTLNKSLHYLIRNSYFFLQLKPDPKVSKYFKILSYRKKAPVSPPFHRVKPIVLTMACTHMCSHQCLGLTPSYSNRELYETIPPDIATNQHYRNCPLSWSECRQAIKNAMQDDSMLAFKDLLTSRVQKKVNSIMGATPKDFLY